MKTQWGAVSPRWQVTLLISQISSFLILSSLEFSMWRTMSVAMLPNQRCPDMSWSHLKPDLRHPTGQQTSCIKNCSILHFLLINIWYLLSPFCVRKLALLDIKLQDYKSSASSCFTLWPSISETYSLSSVCLCVGWGTRPFDSPPSPDLCLCVRCCLWKHCWEETHSSHTHRV